MKALAVVLIALLTSTGVAAAQGTAVSIPVAGPRAGGPTNR